MKLVKFIALIAVMCFTAVLFTSCASQPAPKDDTNKEMAEGERKPHNGEMKPEDGERKPHNGEMKPEDGERKPENGERKPEDGERKPEDGERKPEDGERKPEDGERKPEDGERKPEDEKKPLNIDDLNKFKAAGLVFGSPEKLTVVDLGDGAVEFQLPHKTDPNTKILIITFYQFPEGGDVKEQMEYGKSTYLGTTEKAEDFPKRRLHAMEMDIEGQMIKTGGGNAPVLEAFLVPVAGTNVFIGTKTLPMGKRVAGEVIKAIFDTLKPDTK